MAANSKVYVTEAHREIGDANKGIEKTFRAAAATKYTAGDFAIISNAGLVTINDTNDEIIDGIVTANVDNTNGGDGDIMVPVLLKGNVWVDCLVGSSGSFDDPFKIGTLCGIGGDSTNAATGTAVVATGTSGKRLFTSLSIQAKPNSGVIVRKGLFFFRGSDKFV